VTEDSAARCSRRDATIAGVLAAATSLAVSEIASAVAGNGTSLVTAVGTEFVERFGGVLKELAVALFGTHNKAALVAGIVAVSLVLGGLLGRLAARRFAAGAAGFVAFGALGGWAYASDAQGSALAGFLVAALSVAAGLAVLAVLLRLAPRAPAMPDEPVDGVACGGTIVVAPGARMPDATTATRRTFLTAGVVVGASAAALAASGRRLRTNEVVNEARRRTVLPRPARTAGVPSEQPFRVDGLTPYVTPTQDFYRIDTALTVPQVDVSAWRLRVDGLVDRPFSITYDELLAMESVEHGVTLQCVSNKVGGRLVGNAVWQGVPLAALLERAGVRPEGDQVVGRSVDRWTAGFPTALAFDGRSAIVAYAMNGEPLPARHGFPARLVVSGLYGYVSATKWLRQIELTTWDGFDGYWITSGWAKEGPVKTASRIDVPGSRTPAGRIAVAGVAWAPHRGIDAVELQIDDGPWLPCELGRVASVDTWVQWRYLWDAPQGSYVLRVRAIDGTGEVQTGEVRAPDPDGATGWHSRRVNVLKA
jgi:DMSO/TMAO reductase YedYZ molybdopterin-dependent catalytic subunit